MMYRSKLLFLKSAVRLVRLAKHFPGVSRLVAAGPKSSRDKVSTIVENEIKAAHIRKYVPGKTFLDAGCMWATNGAYVFYAEKCGAIRSVGMDVMAARDAFTEYKQAHASSAEFIQGDINSRETMARIGEVDVILCNCVLYHTPDPFLMLTRLREICRETLLLYTATIPEMHGLQNIAVFYPYLDEKQRSMWNSNTTGNRFSLTGPYAPDRGYANWFWGMTPSCVASLAQCAGFQVESVIKHRPFTTMLVCRSSGSKPQSAMDPAIHQRPPMPAAASA